MSRFDELCKEYAASRDRYFRYRDECHEIAGSLIDGLVVFLGCSKDAISFRPANEADERPGTSCSLMGAMDLKEDACWHFMMGILVYQAPNISPKQLNLFDFALKKKAERFVVKVAADGKEFAVDPKDVASFAPIYEEVLQLMMTRYKTGLEKFLEKDDQGACCINPPDFR